MTMQMINGGTQIKSGTVTTTQLSSSAGVTDGQLASSYLYANGTRALTGNLSAGSNLINNLANGVSSNDAINLGQAQALLQGISNKMSADWGTVGTESFTVSSGNVTQISGTSLDGNSPSVNDVILIKDAPASTGTGSVGSTQPGNGLYTVTSNTTNLSLSRAADMSGSNQPEGAFVFVEGGTVNKSSGWVVSSPAPNVAVTYGTTSIAFTQFSGAGEISVANVLAKSGNQLSVGSMSTGTIILGNGGTPTITTLGGDATVGATGTLTVAAGAITLSKMANLAANSVIGNSTGSSATPTAVALSQSSSASSIPIRDTNQNAYANSFIEGCTVVSTAGGTTTLTVASTPIQQFTGSTTQTLVMPNATTLVVGAQYWVANRSTGVVTVNANGGSGIQNMAGGSQMLLTLVANGSSAGTWDVGYLTAGGTGTVTTVSVATSNGFQGSVATATTTPVITIQTSLSTGVIKSNGSNQFVLATAGTDYLAPSDLVVREVPSGTINSSTTSFSLANTPISGSEMIFQNGLLLIAGSGKDYTISGGTLTFTTAPATGDTLLATYWH